MMPSNTPFHALLTHPLSHPLIPSHIFRISCPAVGWVAMWPKTSGQAPGGGGGATTIVGAGDLPGDGGGGIGGGGIGGGIVGAVRSSTGGGGGVGGGVGGVSESGQTGTGGSEEGSYYPGDSGNVTEAAGGGGGNSTADYYLAYNG